MQPLDLLGTGLVAITWASHNTCALSFNLDKAFVVETWWGNISSNHT